MAVAVVQQDGLLTDPSSVVNEWRDRIKQAREDRRRFEPTWLSNMAFAAGKHYLMWDRVSRQLVLPREQEEAMSRGELYTADIITERRMRILGELSSDDDRPELLLVDGDEGGVDDDYQSQINRGVGYGWDHEWRGDEALFDLRRKVIDLGTAAVRVRFDPTAGPVKQRQVPFKDGKPLLDLEQARTHVAETAEAGGTADLRTMHEGRIRWETLSPFNLLVPSGVEHEKDFPWEIVVRPVLIEKLQEEYGDKAAGLVEDTDIGNIMGVDAKADGEGRGPQQGSTPRLRGHVWLYTCMRRPTGKYPKGQVVVIASNDFRLLDMRDELPYCAPDGTYRTGITYFHWWRVTGRFWSRALIEPMKDIQRRVNKRTNQIDKTIDRGQPFVIVDKNGGAAKRRGFPVELLALEPTERAPVVSSGVQPGAWMYQDKDDAIKDLERASGLGEVALGQNPTNVNNYSQLALLGESESVKRQVIRKEHSTGIAMLVEDSAHDIAVYWGSDKQILLDADDDRVESRVFNATKLQDMFFIVRPAKGSGKPRTQAAELKKIDDVWSAALNSQAVARNPERWVRWYRESLDAGQALELPEEPGDEQVDKAELENHLLTNGQQAQVAVAYYDPPQVHIPLHRDAQIAAEMAGDVQAVAAIEHHVQEHLLVAQQVAEQYAQENPQPAPGKPPETPPGPPGQPPQAGS